jgi:hypothetical protein
MAIVAIRVHEARIIVTADDGTDDSIFDGGAILADVAVDVEPGVLNPAGGPVPVAVDARLAAVDVDAINPAGASVDLSIGAGLPASVDVQAVE